LRVLVTNLGLARVVVEDGSGLAEAALDLGAYDRGDLLRRPGWSSAARAGDGLTRQVVHVDFHSALVHHVALPPACFVGPRIVSCFIPNGVCVIIGGPH